jgi:signal transduction histidine kinase/DNA-binding response OmpR family regulator/CHASE3 domain sensor protein
MRRTSNSIIYQLKIVFTASVLLLLVSLVASFYSTQKLIYNSQLVNHTNQVLIESENIISFMKDAETGQRGFLLTLDSKFLEPYNGAYEKANAAYSLVLALTVDNEVQQKMLIPLKERLEARFAQMDRVIDMAEKDETYIASSERRIAEMNRGKKIMDDVRMIINQVKAEEESMLKARLSQQELYIQYTPYLLLIAALVSILITGFAYVRIRRDMGQRIAQQEQDDKVYQQTRRRIAAMEEVTEQISGGNYSIRSSDKEDDDLGRISSALNTMTESLQKTFTDLEDRTWLQGGSMRIADAIRGERILKNLSVNLIETITSYINAPVGTIYIQDKDWNFKLTAAHAAAAAPDYLFAGDGISGQVILSKEITVVSHIPDNYLMVKSTLGATIPAAIVVIPLIHSGECIGIIELGMLVAPNELEQQLFRDTQDAISIGINSALDYVKLQNFLEETQAQSEELQAQHNELENLNSELEAQAQKLQASDEELRVQQEELQQINEELEERSGLLEERNYEIRKKAAELELTTRYKSEFLANMSHELRTPLNSILLLSRLLAENEEKNMTADQVEYASVIRSSGNGLLGLIDEILDLSKIEAGKMELDYVTSSVKDICQDLKALFAPVAKDKGLELNINISGQTPSHFETDKTRLEQVLKNLVSNALKFTSQGAVSIDVRPGKSDDKIEFEVHDTGIGIAPDKLHLIFEAFQQADGSTKRKYGGTGLGLSISRELVKLLGGEIWVTSAPGEGSHFFISIPTGKEAALAARENEALPLLEMVQPATSSDTVSQYVTTTIPENIPDDRADILDSDKVILIVEDDTLFARTLQEYTRKKGYKCIVAVRGDEGLQLAEVFKPMGILLDIELPVMSGWQVMDALKSNAETRHIPVHIMSSHRMKNESLLKGAVDFIDKPMVADRMKEVFDKIEYVISKKSKKVLIVEDNSKHAKALAYFLETFNINSELKSNITEGVEALQNNQVDCVILDMGIPDKRAYETLEEAKKNPGLENIPIIIFTGKSLSLSEEQRIKKYADSIIVKTAHSYQRMLDEVSLFLHVVEENKKPATESDMRKLGALSDILKDKTVLIADDDVRNIFSLSKSLENYKMNIVTALDGKEALARLHENPEIDVVLLDMMMPQMDGYETAKRIRENHKWRNLPVIAVTAKAMTGDREKCINAGASDYITKPVDIDQLLSLLRVWLYEKA